MIDSNFCKLSQNFELCEIVTADAGLFSDDSIRLSGWLSSGRSGDLGYMCRPRCGFDHILPGAKSVVVVGQFYDTHPVVAGVARYATGSTDYHLSLKNRLWALLEDMRTVHPTIRGRAVVDTAPILEKSLARSAGFGWVGRNSLIVNGTRGSFFNLGLLLVDLDLVSSTPMLVADGCGDCRLCVDSCPMGALGEDRMVDARRCISALTVERSRRGQPSKVLHGWKYGCDICQNVCPYNR